MDLTRSFQDVLPSEILQRYEIRETRNAAKILQSTNGSEFEQVVTVLGEFQLQTEDIVNPGGNKSAVAARIDRSFRELGWREARLDTTITATQTLMPYREAGEDAPTPVETEVFNEGYKVDNVKGRVALDVEWNAKDGNLDRDLGAYRALYEAGVIDGAIIVTRTQDDLRDLAAQLGADAKKFGTTTTTNLTKLEPRLTRGDGGGCPVLAIAITARCMSR